MQTTFSEALSGLLRCLTDTAKRHWQRFAAAAEFERLDGHEQARIAGELGISRDELRELASKDKTSADLLPRRMESIGLDPRTIDPAVMRDMQRCCSKCRDKTLCVHELEDKPREVTWPRYCPNEATLGALSAEQSKRMEAKRG